MEALLELRQVEEEVLRLPEDRRLAVDLGARVDQVDGVEQVAAVVALVATRILVPADRARAFDVAVGQRVSGRRRERAHRRLLDQVPVLPERPEDVARHARMVLGRRPGEEVVADPEPPQVLADLLAVEVDQLLVASGPPGRPRS